MLPGVQQTPQNDTQAFLACSPSEQDCEILNSLGEPPIPPTALLPPAARRFEEKVHTSRSKVLLTPGRQKPSLSTKELAVEPHSSEVWKGGCLGSIVQVLEG